MQATVDKDVYAGELVVTDVVAGFTRTNAKAGEVVALETENEYLIVIEGLEALTPTENPEDPENPIPAELAPGTKIYHNADGYATSGDRPIMRLTSPAEVRDGQASARAKFL